MTTAEPAARNSTARTESPTETPSLVTTVVWASVLIGVGLAVFALDLLGAGLLAMLAGGLVAVGLLFSARETRGGQIAASCAFSLAGTAFAAAIALSLLGTYDSFRILTVPFPDLLARAVPFLLVSLGATVAAAGAVGTRNGPTLATGVAPATTTFAVVVLVQLALSTLLLWTLFARNLAALGYTPGGFLIRALFGIGTTRPAPGAFLFLCAWAAVLVGFALVRLDVGPESAERSRFLLLGAITGGLSAPASVATHLGVLSQLATASPTFYVLLDLVTTNLLLRVGLLGVIVVTAVLLAVRRFDTASPGDLFGPAVAVVGGVSSPVLLAVTDTFVPIVEYLLDRAPPDATTIIREMLAISGSIELLVGASAAATIFLGVAIAVLSLLLDEGWLPHETLAAGLAGSGTIAAGIAVVVHDGPVLAGFAAVGLGLFGWELSAYGRSLAVTVGQTEDLRVALVHTGAVAGVLFASVVASYGVTVLARSGVVPNTSQAGIAALVVVLGGVLVVGALRQSRPHR